MSGRGSYSVSVSSRHYHHSNPTLDQNIRLSKEEIGEWKDHPALVQLSDGSGYYATLSVYHSIHCMWLIQSRSLMSNNADTRQASNGFTTICTLTTTTPERPSSSAS